MLEIDDLTYRIGQRALFDGARASLSEGWKVGLVGRTMHKTDERCAVDDIRKLAAIYEKMLDAFFAAPASRWA